MLDGYCMHTCVCVCVSVCDTVVLMCNRQVRGKRADVEVMWSIIIGCKMIIVHSACTTTICCRVVWQSCDMWVTDVSQV